MFQHCKRLLISAQKSLFFSCFTLSSPACLPNLITFLSVSWLNSISSSNSISSLPGSGDQAISSAPWGEAWWPLSYSQEIPTEWNCLLTCLGMAKKNSFPVWPRSSVPLKFKVRTLCPRFPWVAVSSGSLRSSLNARNTGLGASANSFVPKMAMRMEAEGTVKCTGFHPCCYQNKNDLYFGPPGSTEMTCHLLT